MDEDWSDEQWAVDDIDALEDEATDAYEAAATSRHGRSIKTRLGVSVPGAIGGVILVCALAFGASLTGSIRPLDGSDTASTDVGSGDGAEAPGPGDIAGIDTPGADEPGAGEPAADEPGAGEPGTDEPGADEPGAGEPDATPTAPAEEHPDATPKPTEKPEPKSEPKPDPTPEPKPELAHFHLELSLHEGAVLIDWTSCEVSGADVYKVVRSSDSTITWPMGEHDQLIKVVEVGSPTKTWDEHAPAGRRSWYRVFCLKAGDGEYHLVGVSNTESIVRPAEPTPTPTPEPQSLSIELGTEGSAVVVHWEACTGDAFSHYRILRKTDGEPRLLAEVEGASNTTFVDSTVESGVEYHYLVQCKGHSGDGYFLLGTSGWAGIVAP